MTEKNEYHSEKNEKDFDANDVMIKEIRVEFEEEEYIRKEKEDGPWSFVIAMATFLSQILGGGFTYMGGYFYTIFTDNLQDTSTVTISWMCNMPISLYFLGCLFASALTNKYGYRTCGFLGGFFMFVGLSLCYVANDIVILFICYGLIAGFGCGLSYIPFATALSQYFKKYRTMMLILTTSGSSVGMGIFSFLLPFLEHQFHWRGMLLVLGATSGHFCALACVLFPFNPQSKTTNSFRLFKISLLRRKRLSLMFCSTFMINLSNALLLLHLPSFILSRDLGPETAIASLTLYAISNGSGKITFGIMCHLVNWNIYIVYIVSILIDGICVCVMPAWSNKYWILTAVSVMAFMYNVSGGLFAAIVRDLVTQDEFADGVGLGFIFKGIGTVLAGPVAGLLYTSTNAYSTTIYASGIAFLVGCCLAFPVTRSPSDKIVRQVSMDS